MKILYHHRTQAQDGCRVHIEELIASLRSLGHDVIVVAPQASEKGPEASGEGGLVDRLRRTLPKAAYELLELAYAVLAFAKLYRAYRRHRPDILYERYNLYTPTGAWLKRLTGIPVLLEVNSPMVHERGEHGGLALPFLARWTERMAWRRADRVLPVTAALAGHVRAAGVPADRIAVIPNGINPSGFSASTTDAGSAARARLGLDGRIVLGFTGFVREWHRLEQVVALLAEPGLGERLHLLLVGDGPARAGIEEHARRSGVADRVTVTGVLPHDAVADHVAAFDVALQPAVTSYASPLKVFEYMWMGRAIVAPDMPNIREVLGDGDNGLLFDPAVPDAFGAAVRRLCGDDGLRARLGARARETIVERDLTWDGNARRVAALAEELLAARPAIRGRAGATPQGPLHEDIRA